MHFKDEESRDLFVIVLFMIIMFGSLITVIIYFGTPAINPGELITVTGYTTEETTTETTTTTSTTTTTEMTTTTTTTTEETTITTEETTTETTTTTVKTNKTTTTTTKKEKTTTTEPNNSVNPTGVSKNNLKLLGTFTGTYYKGDTYTCKGGSERTLIDCKSGGQGVKGSVASRYVYDRYKYWHNGRTKVYIEVPSMPHMTGWYYVDDYCGSSSVVDFYYHTYDRVPFRSKGIIECKVYI